MLLDSSMLLVNIQLALMGIVLVAGLFYLWRMICRVERKVDDFIDAMNNQDFFGGGAVNDASPVSVTSNKKEVVEDDDDQFMKEVFGAQPSFTKPTAAVNLVQIEEVDATDEPAAPSEADTTISASGVSKSKIKRMSVDALRDLCKEKGLSTEGTKVALQERLME